MTSWQNILDHLPTGATGRPATQSNLRQNDESTQKTPNHNINNNEGNGFVFENLSSIDDAFVVTHLRFDRCISFSSTS